MAIMLLRIPTPRVKHICNNSQLLRKY
uniref:Uncharacterized protein n=1 Tax=Arundo donax TaxID=35708 RepID=A0A0A9FPZ5_ARUDO